MPKSASSLILAEERDGELVYACRVGSGIGDAKARELFDALSKIERDAPAVAVAAHAGRPLGRAGVERRDRLPQPLGRGCAAGAGAPQLRAAQERARPSR